MERVPLKFNNSNKKGHFFTIIPILEMGQTLPQVHNWANSSGFSSCQAKLCQELGLSKYLCAWCQLAWSALFLTPYKMWEFLTFCQVFWKLLQSKNLTKSETTSWNIGKKSSWLGNIYQKLKLYLLSLKAYHPTKPVCIYSSDVTSYGPGLQSPPARFFQAFFPEKIILYLRIAHDIISFTVTSKY